MNEAAASSDEAATSRANPFVGPRALRYGEPIHGRAREIHDLCSLVVAQRIVLLYAPSGAGKSSLVGAGLRPELERRQFHVFPAIRVGFEPPDSDRARNRYVLSALTCLEEARPTAARLDRSELTTITFDEYIDRLLDDSPSELEPCLLFDQFEELVTLDPSDADAKRTFLREVGVALRDRGRWAVFSMREDFIAQLDPYLDLIPNRLTTRYRLDLLAATTAVGTVQDTAEHAGVQFTDGAADLLVDDLRRVRVQRGSRSAVELGPTVEPVQLQVVCRQLWSTIAPSATRIDRDDVAALGRVDDALADFYDHQVREVSERTGATGREIRMWFDEELISESGFRTQVLDGPGAHGAGVLRELENAHLIRAERRRGTEWYELAHDRMIDPIRASNAAWRERILGRLQRDAQDWDRRGRPLGLVLTGAALDDAEHWASEHRDELTTVDEDFLSASRAEQHRVETERQAARRRIVAAVTISAALAILAVVAIVFAVVAERQRNLAEQAKEDAQRERRTALARQLASSSLESGAASRPASLLLAIEAVRATEPDGVRIPSAEQALRAALADPLSTQLGTAQPGGERALQVVAFSPDGSMLATGSADGSITLWDPADTDRGPQVLDRAADGIRALGFSDNGRWFATGDQDGVVRVWDTTELDRPPLQPSDHHSDAVTALAFTADGTQLATASRDETTRVWRLDEGDDMSSVVLHDHTGFVNGLAFDPSGKHLVTASGDGTALLYDLGDLDAGPVPVLSTDDRIGVAVVSFSPDGRWLAMGDAGGGVTLVDMTSGPSSKTVDLRQQGAIRTLDFSADGRWLVTGSDDAPAQLWNLTDPPNTSANGVVLPGSNAAIVRFSASGRMLATGSGDHLGRLYDVENLGADPVVLSGHDGDVTTLAFAGDELLATGSADGTVRLWDLDHLDRQPRPLGPVEGGGAAEVSRPVPSALAVSGDGRRVAAGDADKVVRVWDVDAPEAPPMELAHATVPEFEKAGIDALAFTPDGRTLVTGGGDRIVRTWDLDAPAAPVDQPPLSDAVTSLSVHPGGRWLAIGTKGESVLVRDLDDPTLEPKRLPAGDDEVTDVAFTPDGAWLVTGSLDNQVRRWPVADLTADPVVWSAGEQVTSVTVSADSARIAAGGKDGTVLVWDVVDEAGAQPLTLVADAPVHSLAFGGGERPGGNLLVVAGDALQSWDLDAPDPESPSVNPAPLDTRSPTRFVEPGPAGGFTSVSADGVARVWLPLAALDDVGCRAAGRNLTAQEWKALLPGERYRATCEQWPAEQ